MIQVEGLVKRFTSNGSIVEALGGLDFEVPDNQFLAVVGPSGCGKSTLLMIIAGLTSPTAGRVFIDGKQITGPHTELGIVFQNHVLLDWLTTLENVLFQTDMRRLPRSVYEPRARDLLRMVSLEGFENRRPYELSGGMKQRASICRALLHDPPLLLMDEPFGALDALTRDQLCIDLEKIWLKGRKTVIFVTHSVAEAVQLADRVIVMTPRPGRIYRDLTIDLPRPRYSESLGKPEYQALVDQIKLYFMEQGVLHV